MKWAKGQWGFSLLLCVPSCGESTHPAVCQATQPKFGMIGMVDIPAAVVVGCPAECVYWQPSALLLPAVRYPSRSGVELLQRDLQ